MQTLESTATDTGATHVVSRRDPVARGAFVDMEVEARAGNVALPYGWLLPAGKHKIRVPKSEVAGILAKVEDEPEKWAQACKSFEVEVARMVRDRVKRGAKKEERDTAEKYVRDTISSSPQSHFRAMFDRTRRPLLSARVLPGEYPPPAREEIVSEQAALAAIVAEAVATALARMQGGQPRKA